MLKLENSYFHYFVITISFLISLLYAIPNLYPDQPCISISANNPKNNLEKLHDYLVKAEAENKFKVVGMHIEGKELIIRFDGVESQMAAMEHLEKNIHASYSKSLNLLPSTPDWLRYIGAKPMKLGLDLRGGVHLLLEVDTAHQNEQNHALDSKEILRKLRSSAITYQQAQFNKKGALSIEFNNKKDQENAHNFLKTHFPNHDLNVKNQSITIRSSQQANQAKSDYIIQKTLESVQNRVNELGLSEAIVQKQGNKQISVDIPGIQDINRAKAILGNTATLSFHMVSYDKEAKNTSKIQDRDGRTYEVEKYPLLKGDAITYATTSSQDGQPLVQVRLGGGNEQAFYQATQENVGKQMAIVLHEKNSNANSKKRETHSRIISAPVIQQALGSSFVINGMQSLEESETLALLLRSGSLAAPIDIVEEKTIGPSLGAENIQKGLTSIVMGFSAIVLFMIVYYRKFGIIANIGLFFNLIMIVTLLSWLDATLTLPAMAAVVLSVGMAVDANVLIHERIREELRLGKTDIKALHLGYDKAFSTILDANITTLIVSLVLYSLSSGMIKGFSITLILGLVVSMFTSVYVTRIISWRYFHQLGDLKQAVGI